MTPTSTLLEPIEFAHPIPVDIDGHRGVLPGKKAYLEPMLVTDGQPFNAGFFRNPMQKDVWGKPQLGAYLGAISRDETKVLQVNSHRPRHVENSPLSSYTRVANVISLTANTVSEIQSKLLSAAHEHEFAQLQMRLEKLSNFFFIYALQEVRLQSVIWQGALAGYLCRLTAAALPTKPEGEGALGFNVIGDSLRPSVLGHIIAVIVPYLGYRNLSPCDAVGVNDLRRGLEADIDIKVAESLTRGGVDVQYLDVAKQFLKAAIGASIAVLEKSLGSHLPYLSLLRRALSGNLHGRELVGIRRIEKLYGAFLPGELLKLATGEVALVYGVNSHLREPKLIRVLGANGMPYIEPLFTRNPETARNAMRCKDVQIGSPLCYPALISGLRLT